MRSQRGFTLIELLTVCAIIGILAKISITAIIVYKANAAYSNVQKAVHDVRLAAEAGTLDSDNLPAAVPLTTQQVPGSVANPLARSYLIGMQIPINTSVAVSYDPTCQVGACVSGFAEVRHRAGRKYIQWMRFGDGSDLLVEDIAGAGF